MKPNDVNTGPSPTKKGLGSDDKGRAAKKVPTQLKATLQADDMEKGITCHDDVTEKFRSNFRGRVKLN